MSFSREDIQSLVVSLNNGEEIEYRKKGINTFLRSMGVDQTPLKKAPDPIQPGYRTTNLNYKEVQSENVMDHARRMQKEAEDRLGVDLKTGKKK